MKNYYQSHGNNSPETEQSYYLNYKDTKLGILTVNKEREILLKLEDNIEPLEVPFELLKAYNQGQRVFHTQDVMRWIKERVVPSSRQNIDGILKQVGIDKYDELSIFLYAKGRFNFDGYYLESI